VHCKRKKDAQPLSNWFGDAFNYNTPTSISIDTHEVIG
jgi:hypothetical protein